MKYDLSHLEHYFTYVTGPIQDDEALLIFGIVRVIRPAVIVEFGFGEGHSTQNFLRCIDVRSRLYSIDSSLSALERSKTILDSRFKFIHMTQEDVRPEHYDSCIIDLMFIDCSHSLLLNQVTFKHNVKQLSDEGVLVVHDTGKHRMNGREGSPPSDHREACMHPDTISRLIERDVLTRGIHQGEERRFINWIRESGEYDIITLESSRIWRHGLSIVQRKKTLLLE